MEFVFNIRPIFRQWNEELIAGLSDLINEGIGYWATEQSPEVHPLPLLFVVTEDEALDKDGPKTHRIDLATIAAGLNRIASYECPINTASLGNIMTFIATNDLQYIDSEDVDLIVQAGIYNDIKWG